MHCQGVESPDSQKNGTVLLQKQSTVKHPPYDKPPSDDRTGVLFLIDGAFYQRQG